MSGPAHGLVENETVSVYKRSAKASVILVNEGQRVWYRPQLIGYGYNYGTDYGIPAVVVKQIGGTVWIDFLNKVGEPIPTRRVSLNTLEERS